MKSENLLMFLESLELRFVDVFVGLVFCLFFFF